MHPSSTTRKLRNCTLVGSNSITPASATNTSNDNFCNFSPTCANSRYTPTNFASIGAWVCLSRNPRHKLAELTASQKSEFNVGQVRSTSLGSRKDSRYASRSVLAKRTSSGREGRSGRSATAGDVLPAPAINPAPAIDGGPPFPPERTINRPVPNAARPPPARSCNRLSRQSSGEAAPEAPAPPNCSSSADTSTGSRRNSLNACVRGQGSTTANRFDK